MTTRQTPMMGIPLKVTEDVDLATPLRHYIRANYGTNEKYAEECKAISRLRQDMRGAAKDTMGRDLCYRYYGQLELLELRFQIDEDHIRINFTWFDAFTDVDISQYSLAYEKACVLFNLTAILSAIALGQQRSTQEGMKKAYHSFQAAAGLLNFINDNFMHAPSTDLSRDVVKMIATVMLAQAQEVFTEKQIRDSGKPTIIAKLCAQAQSLYFDANEALTELVLAGHIDRHWSHYCFVKDKFFGALAQHYQGVAEEEKSHYGEAVARFAAAAALAKEAHANAKSYSGDFGRYPHLSVDPGPGLVEVTKTYLDLLNEKLAASKKENDVIYHDVVPKESALSAIPKLVSAKPISLHDLYAGQDVGQVIGPDIFQKLVPMSVHESASVYTEEIAKMLRNEQEKADIAETELATALDYLGLPRALHQFKQNDEQLERDFVSIPAALRDSTDSIHAQQRQKPLQSTFDEIARLRASVRDLLASAARSLDEEQKQCEHMRAKFQGIWTQRPSSEVNGNMRQDIDNFLRSLDQAGQSDEQMQREFASVRAELDELAVSDVEGILAAMASEAKTGVSSQPRLQPTGNAASLLDLMDEPVAGPDVSASNASDAIAIKVDQVDDLVRKLNFVKKERAQTLADLKEKARNDDISDVLVLNKRHPGIEQRVFQAELEKFRPHQTRLQALVSRQEQILEELQATFAEVLQDKSQQDKVRRWDIARKRRDEKLSKLDLACKLYPGLTQGTARASKFYSDLDGLAKRTEAAVKQFITARQNEGREILNRRQQGAAGLSHGSGAPPVPSYRSAPPTQSPSAGTNSLRAELEGLSLGSVSQAPQQPRPY
ncbi:bck1-like resistance to osmotic shock [Savitreella phatthalungensis]